MEMLLESTDQSHAFSDGSQRLGQLPGIARFVLRCWAGMVGRLYRFTSMHRNGATAVDTGTVSVSNAIDGTIRRRRLTFR